jgi:hypothetical protein
MIFNPYAMLGAGALLLASHAGAYFYGVGNGRDDIRAEAAKALKVAAKELREAETAIAEARILSAKAEAGRVEIVREINREIPTIVQKPVYRNVCIDDDGVRLIERARSAANGEPAGGPAPGPGSASGGSGKDGRQR